MFSDTFICLYSNMVVYNKILSVVQDSRMRSLCNNLVVHYGDRIIIKSIMHSTATVHYEEIQDFRVHLIHCTATWLL